MQQVGKTAVPTLNQRYTTFFQAARFVLGFSLIFVIGWAALPQTIPLVLMKNKQHRPNGVLILGGIADSRSFPID
jgi:cytochrome c biogenesis protein CcdA